MTKEIAILNEDSIRDKIYTIRSMKVMLDEDLAKLYDVTTGNLNKAVNRNIERFPEDFMFKLTKDEYEEIRSKIIRFQNGILENQQGKHRKFLPFVFTEQGVATLSGVLKSKKAIEVNIKIMRAFVSMRKFISQNAELFNRLENIDRKLLEHDKNFEKVFNAIEGNTLTKKQGIFYDGQMFDAYKFVSDLIKKAKSKIKLIDNFIDESTLTLFSEKNKNVEVIIYTKNISNKLRLSLEKFNSQYNPIEIKEFNKSHDRFLIIDKEIYHFGASLKDLGKKWFAFSKLGKESVRLLEKLKEL